MSGNVQGYSVCVYAARVARVARGAGALEANVHREMYRSATLLDNEIPLVELRYTLHEPGG